LGLPGQSPIKDFESTLLQLLHKQLKRAYGKGAIYFSPLMSGGQKPDPDLKRQFYKFKTRSRLPTFLYLIQRL
jgi:hypothetical protein